MKRCVVRRSFDPGRKELPRFRADARARGLLRRSGIACARRQSNQKPMHQALARAQRRRGATRCCCGCRPLFNPHPWLRFARHGARSFKEQPGMRHPKERGRCGEREYRAAAGSAQHEPTRDIPCGGAFHRAQGNTTGRQSLCPAIRRLCAAAHTACQVPYGAVGQAVFATEQCGLQAAASNGGWGSAPAARVPRIEGPCESRNQRLHCPARR
jgi:hypothetical protein